MHDYRIQLPNGQHSSAHGGAELDTFVSKAIGAGWAPDQIIITVLQHGFEPKQNEEKR